VIDPKMFEELRSRIDEAFRNSPAQDIEKNLRALLSSWFERLDLVLREDFEVQKKLLERAQAKLGELEARMPDLIANQDVLSAEGQYPYVFEADAGFTRSERPNLAANDRVRSSVSRTATADRGPRAEPRGLSGSAGR